MNWTVIPGLIAVLVTGAPVARGVTRVSLAEGKWNINGAVTHPGSAAQGLLMNVRMVNSCFEDRAVKKDFDADANTERFVGKISEYHEIGRAHV